MVTPNSDPGLDRVFDALANDHRRQIIYALATQPWSISQLAEQRDLTLPAIHKHINVLEGANLVSRRKAGRTTYLSLKRHPLRSLQSWAEQFHTYWGSDAESLANYEESLEGNNQRKEKK